MYVKARVTPGGKKEMVKKTKETEFDVIVKEKAERNLANKRVRQILAEEYDVTIGSVRLISGHRSNSKIFDVEI